MTDAADRRTEYALVADLRPYIALAAAVVAGAVGLGIWEFTEGLDGVEWQFVAPVGLLLVALGWTVTRNLVLQAALEGGRLRARTAPAQHDVAVDAIDEICWRVDEGRIGSMFGPGTIRYATLDDRTLHAVTGDGQEHDVPLDTIEDIDDRREGGDSGEVVVHHRGGELRIVIPVGGELADRLLAARAAP